MHTDQLTVSKHGAVKFGSTLLAPMELDHMQSIIVAEVDRLHRKFIEKPASIWLVGETIHIWINQTTWNFHWSDTDAIEAILNER